MLLDAVQVVTGTRPSEEAVARALLGVMGRQEFIVLRAESMRSLLMDLRHRGLIQEAIDKSHAAPERMTSVEVYRLYQSSTRRAGLHPICLKRFRVHLRAAPIPAKEPTHVQSPSLTASLTPQALETAACSHGGAREGLSHPAMGR
jgi:hypothetical protein